MLKVFKRIIDFVELMMGLFLPFRLRCKYSELLLIFKLGKINNIMGIGDEKERDFDMFSHLGSVYAQEGKMELAVENLNRALEVDPDNNKARDIHLFFSRRYRAKEELDKSIDEIVTWYKKWKKQST